MKDETIQGNKLIEKFWIEQGGKPHIEEDISFYESDWNMLMPVVEKIESMNYLVRIHGSVCDISDYQDNSISYWKKENPKIANVWIAIVLFIKHYNKTPYP